MWKKFYCQITIKTFFRTIAEIKQRQALSLLKWVTAYEYQFLKFGCGCGLSANASKLIIGEPRFN